MGVRKKRVAVTISFSFSIRYLVRTGLLEKMKSFAEPVICIFWDQSDLLQELRNNGFEVHIIPETRRSDAYSDTRIKIDYWFRYFQLKSPTYNFEPRYIEKFKGRKKVIIQRLREYYNYCFLLIPGAANRLHQKEQKLLLTDTNYSEMLKVVDELNVESVFTVTPFHIQEDTFLRAAKARHKKMITSVLSFDNIVKRGWIPVNYDCYMVWNKYNAAEIERIYVDAVRENKKNIHVVGAAQFDFYWDKKFILEKKEWLQMVGLTDTRRKIILYAGGPVSLFPQEIQFLQHIIESLDKGLIEGNPIVLFRCHPIDKVERWKAAIKPSENIYFDTSWTGGVKLTQANVQDTDISKLCSTLFYTDVHINVASTMTIDGSAFHKPQICPAYDDVYPNTKYPLAGFYTQEHYRYTTKTNGIAFAKNKNELIELINDALKMPEKYITRCEDVLKEVITFTDGKCTNRVIEVLQKEIQN